MSLEILFFVLYILSTIFLILSLIFLIKYKKFQPDQINKSTDVYLFGLVFLSLYSFIMFLKSSEFIVEKFLPNFISNYEIYVNYLMLISNLSFVLLMSICYLIAVLLMKEINT